MQDGLAAGARLGPYEVVGTLGAGGMGQVYRARDSKLGRDVAIKVLPVEFAADRDRLARFTREAQTLASLNHPNIAQIHGLEDAAGVRALIMELVDGDDLSAVIARGQSQDSTQETLAIARQIALALEAAHEQGIIHRDLKPANVKVKDDGTVKVLDFGLAKAFDRGTVSSMSASQSPTITSPAMTQLGVLLGTAAYMSPEQARGRPVDKRSDLWAFGAVLFEMCSGRRAFPGEDISDTLANVLKVEPDWSALPPDLPPRVRQVIQACLRKNPKDRLADAQDARLALEGAFETVTTPSAGSVSVAGRPRRGLIAAGLILTALAAGAAASAATWFLATGDTPSAPTRRLSVALPADRQFWGGGSPHRGIAIAPDGSRLVVVARDPAATTPDAAMLVMRSLDTLAVRDLPGTGGARQPFFSPDGQWIGFFTAVDGALKKVRVSGGNPITVVEGINGAQWAFGVWTHDNRIIFGGGSPDGLRSVSTDGGTVTQLTRTVAASDELEHDMPTLVRESGAVIFSVRFTKTRAPRIEALVPGSGERRLVVENAFAPFVLESGHLLFQRDEAIFVAPFDPVRLEITGAIEPLVDEVRRDGSFRWTAQLATSSNGHLAYLPPIDSNRDIGLVTRTGQYTRVEVPAAPHEFVLVSPDGQRLAYSQSGGGDEGVFVHERLRGSTQRLTRVGRDAALAWHPTKPAVAVASIRETGRGIHLLGLDGTDRRLVDAGQNEIIRNASWSPDGSLLAYTVQNGGLHDIWVATIGERVEAKPWLNASASEYSPRFSPNGRWVAYVSLESGREQVLVRGYPSGQSMVVSLDRGQGPLWGRDGKELFFHATHDGVMKLMRVSVSEAGGALAVGRPEPVFEMRRQGPGGFEMFATSGNGGVRYDILPDGKQFVVLKATDAREAREIVVVENWLDELRLRSQAATGR